MFVVFRARLNRVALALALVACLPLVLEAKSKRKLFCVNGSLDAVTNRCICNQGWFGNHCQFGRQRLRDTEGTIFDSPGENGYSSKCLWLIEATSPKSTIQLIVDQFWSSSTSYTLYIYNGSSFRAPLLAAFSGIKEDNCTGQRSTGLIKTTSRAVLIYFFRDSNNVNSGVKLKYSVSYNNCSSRCHGHGSCNTTGQCICDQGWDGDDCSTRTCPYYCVHGTCDVNTWLCHCQHGYSGQSCNISSQHGAWTNIAAINQDLLQGRIGAGFGVIDDWLWVFGGYSIADKPSKDIIRYSFSRNKWQVVSISNSSLIRPDCRYGHSLIVYNKSLIIFGGIVQKNTNALRTLWRYNTITSQWSKVRLDGGDNPIAVAGHTATIVKHRMIVIFGYGPLYGFTNKIQEYDIVTSRWTILNTTGKEGTYGHTSHYDPVTQLIYVHGGRTRTGYSDGLYSYNPFKNHWTHLSGSKVPHLLHSSVLIGHMILVFGGSTFTDSSRSKCYGSDLMVYDIYCDKWSTIPQAKLHVETQPSGVFGHSAVLHNSKMYIFGGFNGVLNTGIFSYTPGNCSFWKDQSSCLSAYPVSGCFWDSVKKTCIGPEEGFSRIKPSCQVECNSLLSCGPCQAPGLNCRWCDGVCKKKAEACKEPPLEDCEFTPSCKGDECERPLLRCEPDNGCNNDCAQCFKRRGNRYSDKPYMWCEAQKKCLALDSYAAVFPNGQCNDWITADCQATKCSDYKSCDSCQTIPGCGWCGDSTITGRGQCVQGGAYRKDIVGYRRVNNMACPRWYYMECPACQCNGHSVCGKGTSCLHCYHHTTGPNCEYCAEGYYGNPINGGACRECRYHCNHHAKHCDSSKCQCLVEGIVGNKCERCDRDKQYVGNATNGQLCYFILRHNSQKVFNVSGKTSLNIQFSPLKTDKDVEFNIEILSGPSARLNITYIEGGPLHNKKEKYYLSQAEIKSSFNEKFANAKYKFHKERMVFRAKLYKMDKTASYQIRVYFNQSSTLNINLLEFFLTFFGCFLSLLFVASIGWRIRSRYHSYLVTRQRRAERDRMANRPFATVHLLLPSDMEPILKQSPSPVAFEPLVKNKVSIATVIMLLPTGEEGVTPVGQCGVCFGSMLLAHGHHQHTCMRTRKGHKKSKKRSTMTTYYL